jgi:hypothetical protein
MEIHTAGILNQKSLLLIRPPLVLLGMTNGQLWPFSGAQERFEPATLELFALFMKNFGIQLL